MRKSLRIQSKEPKSYSNRRQHSRRKKTHTSAAKISSEISAGSFSKKDQDSSSEIVVSDGEDSTMAFTPPPGKLFLYQCSVISVCFANFVSAKRRHLSQTPEGEGGEAVEEMMDYQINGPSPQIQQIHLGQPQIQEPQTQQPALQWQDLQQPEEQHSGHQQADGEPAGLMVDTASHPLEPVSILADLKSQVDRTGSMIPLIEHAIQSKQSKDKELLKTILEKERKQMDEQYKDLEAAYNNLQEQLNASRQSMREKQAEVETECEGLRAALRDRDQTLRDRDQTVVDTEATCELLKAELEASQIKATALERENLDLQEFNRQGQDLAKQAARAYGLTSEDAW